MNLAQKFACSSFDRFINSTTGRVGRIVVGAFLVIWGCTHLGQDSAFIFIILGIIPVAAGALDLCVISPLLGGPIPGQKVRSMNKTN